MADQTNGRPDYDYACEHGVPYGDECPKCEVEDYDDGLDDFDDC